MCNYIKRRSSKGGKSLESMNEYSGGFGSPLKKNYELELQGTLTRKDSEANLSPHAEGRPLVARHKDDLHGFKQERNLTTREVATYGFYIAPIWFITEVRNFPMLLFSTYFPILTMKSLIMILALMNMESFFLH